jgi:multicomponent Na+:H+ antiporter subunit G
MILEYISGIFILIGAVFALLSAIGIIKLPDLYLRMSATTKSATLGVGSVMLGTAIHYGDVGSITKVFVVISFLLLTAPIAAHLLARAAYINKVELWDKTVTDELEGKYDDDHNLKC